MAKPAGCFAGRYASDGSRSTPVSVHSGLTEIDLEWKSDIQPNRFAAIRTSFGASGGRSAVGPLHRWLASPNICRRRISGLARSTRMSSEPDHHHTHDHDRAHNHDGQDAPSETALRVKALESLLVEKGLVDPAALDAHHRHLRAQDRPRNGARVVAPGLDRSRLQGTAAGGRHHGDRRARIFRPQGAHMVVVENTPDRAQPRRLHPVLLLSLAGAGLAAGLVQILGLPVARGDRSARRAARLRPHAGRQTSRCGSGIRPRRSAISCCRNGPQATEGWMRTHSPRW